MKVMLAALSFMLVLLTIPIQESNAAVNNKIIFKVGETKYFVDSVPHDMDAAPVLKENRVFIPLRYLAYALGMTENDISWNNVDRTAILSKDKAVVKVSADSKVLEVNDLNIQMDAAAFVENGRLYLPVRFISNAFGIKNELINWDNITRTVTISPKTLLLKDLPVLSDSELDQMGLARPQGRLADMMEVKPEALEVTVWKWEGHSLDFTRSVEYSLTPKIMRFSNPPVTKENDILIFDVVECLKASGIPENAMKWEPETGILTLRGCDNINNELVVSYVQLSVFEDSVKLVKPNSISNKDDIQWINLNISKNMTLSNNRLKAFYGGEEQLNGIIVINKLVESVFGYQNSNSGYNAAESKLYF